MEDRTDPHVDPRISQAETLAGSLPGAGFQGSLLAARPEDPEFPVKDWDRYEFLGFLGQGGMGKVFLARDKRLGREVAIKFVRLDDSRYLERFLVEARAQARVNHEHVCKVFEVGEVEGKVFITMQHIRGQSLDVAAGDLSLEQKVVVLRDAAQGVHEAHRAGIIHRDLKPSNIMVERGEDGSLKTFVMDFGLAREWNQDVTETGSVLGTPAYMSPEQARGEVSRLDRRTDIYSLGAALYHIATGKPPVAGSNALEILSAISSADVAPLRAYNLDIPKDLEAITLKCLEKDRAKRYDSARALVEDLERFLSGESVLARPTGLWYRVHRKLQKHKQLTAVGAAALVVVLLALGVALKTRRDAGRRERLAQQFTESMARIESMVRYSALSPLHDIRPNLAAVRTHMDELQADMKEAGTLANGPGHYAIGRGYWTLDDDEKAREHLQMAWDAGFREPRAAYALALVLGHQYQDKLLEAERIPSADQREARKREIGQSLREPALAYLRRARGPDAPSPAYLESLLAFYEGRLDEALNRLRALGEAQPWFYEAPLLRGTLLQARAWKRWNQGDRDGAHADFEAGRKAFAAAAEVGRSAPAVHAAMGELELNALFMEKYGEGQVLPPFTRGMAAVQTALAAQPDHAPSLVLASSLLGNLAGYKADHGEAAEELVQQAVDAARKAVEAAPARADARSALGQAYFQWANSRAERNLDPTDQLTLGLQALESLSPEKRDYKVANHLGLLHQTWSEFEDQKGRDPSGHLNRAIEAYEAATRMEPHLLPAWINLGTCLHQRAKQPRAADPEGDLRAALKVLDQARALNPKHFVPHFVQGAVFQDLALRRRAKGEDPRPDFLRSLEAHRRGLAINPKVPHLHNGTAIALSELARCAWDEGEDPLPFLSQAKVSAKRAIAVAPNQVFGYRNLGDLLMDQARFSRGPTALLTLQEAEGVVRKALAVADGNPLGMANQGRLHALRAESILRSGGDPGPSLAAGEAWLAKALALDPGHWEALQYLGGLRLTGARWKALRGRAERNDFEGVAKTFARALEQAPGAFDTLLALGQLWRARAEWERSNRQDPGPSLTQGLSLAEQILRARPAWAEARALRGALRMEQAHGMTSDRRAEAARAAAEDFAAALSTNRNLRPEWEASADLAQRWVQGVPEPIAGADPRGPGGSISRSP